MNRTPAMVAFGGWISGHMPPGRWFEVATGLEVILPVDPGDPDHVHAADMFRYVINEAFLHAVVFGNIDCNYDKECGGGDICDDDSLKGRIDFVALDYHGVTLVRATPENGNYPLVGTPIFNDLDRHGLDAPVSDLGRSIYPQGLRPVIDELVHFERPIVITASGVADSAGTLRPRFISITCTRSTRRRRRYPRLFSR